jgi:putative ABC transport system ATP-binding protein
MAEPFVKITGLHKHYETPYEPLKVLTGIDLEIYPGDFVAVIGPSGVGKTTFLNMVTAVDKPNEGEITINGTNVTRAPQRKLTKWRAKNVGIVFQLFQLLPTLTVTENVMFPMDFGNVYALRERRAIAEDLLNRLGIADQGFKTPDMLSGGQQQRTAIARALANDPPLIIGDEPTANLDRMSTQNVFNIFQEYADRGAAVIITTYDRQIVRNIPIVLELDSGKLRRMDKARMVGD